MSKRLSLSPLGETRRVNGGNVGLERHFSYSPSLSRCQAIVRIGKGVEC